MTLDIVDPTNSIREAVAFKLILFEFVIVPVPSIVKVFAPTSIALPVYVSVFEPISNVAFADIVILPLTVVLLSKSNSALALLNVRAFAIDPVPVLLITELPLLSVIAPPLNAPAPANVNVLAPTLNAFVIDNAPVAVSVEAPLIVTVPPKVVVPAAVSPLDALNTIVPLFDKVPELVNTALNVRVLDALIVNVCDAGIVSAPDKVVE